MPLRLLIGAVALLAVWAAAALYVPPIVAAQIEQAGSQHLGRRTSVGQVAFNPWTLELTLADLVVAGAAPSSPPLLSIKRVRADVAAASIVRFAPVIDALEMDAPMLHVRRLDDGRYDVDDVLQRLAARPDSEPARFAMHNIVVRDGGADFVDQPLRSTHRVRAFDLGVPFVSSLPSQREVKVEPRLAFTLDGSRFDTGGAATPFGERGDGELRVRVERLDVVPFLGYLPRGLPARLRAATLTADLRIAFEQRPRLSLNVTGSVGARDIEVVDAAARDLLRVGSVEVAIDELRPLERRVALRSVAVEAPRVVATRDAAGKVNLLLAGEPPAGRAARVARLPLPSSVASAAAPRPAPGAAASAASAANSMPAADATAWRASVAALSVRAGRLDWHDATTSPAARLGVEGFMLDARSIAWPFAAPVAFRGEGSIAAGPERGKLVFSGSGHAGGAELELSLAALPLTPLQPYLAGVLAQPLAGSLSVQLKVGWLPGGDGAFPNVRVDAQRLAVAGLSMGARTSPELAAEEVELGDVRVDTAARSATMGRVLFRAPTVRVERDRERRWNVERWLVASDDRPAVARPVSVASVPPVTSVASVSPAASPASTPLAGSTVPASPAGRGDAAWTLAIGEAAVERGRIAFNDRGVAVPAALVIRDVAMQLRQWTLDGAGSAPFRVAGRVSVPAGREGAAIGSRAAAGSGVVGSVDVNGELKGFVAGAPRGAQATLLLRDLPLHLLDPYLDEIVNLDVQKAQTSFKGTLRWDGGAAGAALALSGDATIDEFRASNEATERGGQRGLALVRGTGSGRDLLSWKSLSLRGLDLAVAPGQATRLAVAETTLSDFFARLVLDENGRLNLQDVARAAPAGPAASAPTAAPAPSPAPTPAPAPIIELGPIAVAGGRINYTDRFVRPNYSANLSELSGRLGAFSSVARDGAAPLLADVGLRGRVQGTASLEITGKANPLAKPLALDLLARVRDLELPPLSPYAIKYSGYGIERGKMSVDLAYVVQPDGQLTASNKIVLHQLVFGDKVEGAPASLPVKLAVALLADRNGVIDLDLPVSGSINDPQFSLGGVIWKAITGLLAKAVTAPFSLLAAAFDGGSGESARVEFAAGTASLDAAARERLDKIAKALADRPALNLTVVGESRLDAEAEAWKKQRLQQLVRSEKRRQASARPAAAASAASAPAGADPTVSEAEYPTLLKEVYRRADIVKPKNVLGLAKELPTAEMETLLLAGITVDAEAMQQLAVRRGVAVRDYLAGRDIPTARLFLGAPRVAGDDAAWSPRADLRIGS